MKGARGQSIVEMSIGLLVLVPVVLVLLDLAVMLYGVEKNDTTCRNAARAAAAGAPDGAQLRAEKVLDDAAPGRQLMIDRIRLITPVQIEVTSHHEDEQDKAAEGVLKPGGPVIGTTTVTTEVEFTPRLIHLLYGGKTPLRFRATHSFPISFVLPAKFESTASSSSEM